MATKENRRLSLRELCEQRSFSEGYLEEIVSALKKAKLVQGRTGPNGGYILAKSPDQISAREIVEAVEGPIAMVRCHEDGPCPFQGKCQSRKLWDVLQGSVQDVLSRTSLQDLI